MYCQYSIVNSLYCNCQSNNWWRFRKSLWPSLKIWTLKIIWILAIPTVEFFANRIWQIQPLCRPCVNRVIFITEFVLLTNTHQMKMVRAYWSFKNIFLDLYSPSFLSQSCWLKINCSQIKSLDFVNWCCQKVLKFDFQNWCPIFVGPTLCQFTKYCNFIWIQLIFEQKPCFLGPIKQGTPWPNWH